MSLLVQRLSNFAQLPMQRDTGYDIYSAYNYLISHKGGKVDISTGLSIVLPPKCQVQIKSIPEMRKRGIQIGNMTGFDRNGGMTVTLINRGDAHYPVNSGEKIAHLLIEGDEIPPIAEVEPCINDLERLITKIEKLEERICSIENKLPED